MHLNLVTIYYIMRKTIILLLILSFLSGACTRQREYVLIKGMAQGGTYHISYSPTDSLGRDIIFSPDSVERAVNRILIDIDNSLSGYNPYSVLSKINNNSSDTPDSIYCDIFKISYDLYRETGGYFDPAAAPLFDLWGFGFKSGETVSESKIDSILNFVGMDKITVSGDKVIKKDPRVKINFNAIAQGYSCDLISDELKKMGISDFLVEVGMEIYCSGVNPDSQEWKIGIDMPKDGNMEAGSDIAEIVKVTNAGIVTSGNYRKFYIKDGKKYSHTIDPLTGIPVQHGLLSATIIARNATIADAYATYCMVIGLEKSKKFLESRKDLKGYLIYGDQDNMSIYCTENFKELINN